MSVCVCMCVGLSVQKVYCDKTADWIRVPFGMVSGIGRGMGVLDEVVIVEGEEAVLEVNFGRLIVSNGDFVAYSCAEVLSLCICRAFCVTWSETEFCVRCLRTPHSMS